MPATAARPVAVVTPHVRAVERLRRALVPLVAFLAACLGSACLLNLADVALEARDLLVVNDRFAGWAGVGACVGICIAVLAVLAAPRFGAAVPLAMGAAAAVFGLALGRSIFDDVQLALAVVMLGVATGGLLGAAVCLTLEPPAPRRSLTAVAWGVPMVAMIPVLDWLALDSSTSDTLRLALPPPVWPLAIVSVLLVGWSALALLSEPDDAPPGQLDGGQGAQGGEGAESAWTTLLLAALLPTVAAMLLGFEPDISAEWLRPLVIVASAVTVLGLGFACFAMPSAGVRIGYVAVAVVMLCWPACIGLLLLVIRGDAGESRLLLGVVVAAAAASAALGCWRPVLGVVGGLLLLAGGAAGAWALPGSHLLLAVPVAAMAGGAGAGLLGGLRFSLASPLGVRLVGAAAVSAAILGVLLTLPLSWALGGGLAMSPAAASADARVVLGLTFAAAVLGAGYAATLTPRVSAP